MSSDYKPLYSTHRQLTTRNPTWPEQQASMILSLRDIYNPPRSIPDREVQNLDADKQIHARWTDPDLVWALSEMQDSLPGKGKLVLQYGGRDVTAATWVTVHQTSPDAVTELKYVLWFHEYDDLDVEVGDLRMVKWGVKKEEDVEVKLEDLEMEDEEKKIIVKVKVEDQDGHEAGGVSDGP